MHLGHPWIMSPLSRMDMTENIDNFIDVYPPYDDYIMA